MQGYHILYIQDEMQKRIDELEEALGKLCKHAETARPEKPVWGPPREILEARNILQKKIPRRGGNLTHKRY